MEEVKIKISVGVKPSYKVTSRQGVYDVIAHFHNAEISVNPEKTWLAAFQENFGMSLNPDAYFIQRNQYKKYGQFPQRSLTEKIGEWVSKDFIFKKSKAVFKVEIVSRGKNGPRRSITLESKSSSQKAKGFGALIVFKWDEVVLSNDDLSPDLGTLHEKWFRVKDPLLTWLDIFSKQFGVDLDPERYFLRHYVSKSRAGVKEHDMREPVQQLLQHFSHIYPNKANTVLISQRKNNPKPSGERSLVPAGAIPATIGCTPRGQRNVKRKLHFQVPEINPVGDSYSPVDDFISTDEESSGISMKVKEVCQNGGSQQQIYEPIPGSSHEQPSPIRKKNCIKNGKPENNVVQNEDIKEEVYNLASKFTNSQLLKARNEILMLKEMSQRSEARDPWSNWNTTCPLPAAILRDLFNV